MLKILSFIFAILAFINLLIDLNAIGIFATSYSVGFALGTTCIQLFELD